MLEELKRSVFAGKTPERPWEIFRRAQFPTMDDDQAKDALLEWGRGKPDRGHAIHQEGERVGRALRDVQPEK